ncbi:peptidoglycan editing factor PgeF [Dethiobacter alkaliphilus]|uniref:Purine nucleoside phosphorylase n=1 Tax=Dethiobacter alkaliphilus AHT 1 TaxID=555088 RepID=C0GFR8_DETAL|nr:peptidoglycan editing factor PgeF [Dethiobacter alkaliphilus]EEG77607.1 protein of unknown function DUF152 [Dethiobacter alkaliphilus AHT 1]
MLSEEIRETGGIRYLVFNNLTESGVLHGFTLRSGGVSPQPFDTLNMGLHVGDPPAAVLENRRRLAAALGYKNEMVTTAQQVHTTNVVRVTPKLSGRGSLSYEDAFPRTDGLLCTEPNIVLMSHCADCTLLFFYDPKARCIGLAHAGWRGAVAGMGPVMVEAMEEAGCRRENIRAALSPCIRPCCYRVGDNVAEEIEPGMRPHVLTKREGELYFDLPGLQARQLVGAGISEHNLIQSEYCTNCNSNIFFSYRASGGKTGRMAGVMSIVE